MPMKIGLFMTPQWRSDGDLERGIDDIVAQARAVRESGFSSLFVGQHMVTGPNMQMLQTVPLMARLIPEIEGMQIGPGVLLLSMLNAVMVAEEGATIDWLSGGNYVLAVGLGYRPEEFEAMGVRKSHRVSRTEEALALIRRLWTESEVTHHGQHFDVSGVGSSVMPKQSPHPPIWLGGDVEAAVRRAARLADAWLGSPTATLSHLQHLLSAYTDERSSLGLGKPAPCPIIRECFVGNDREHASAVSRSSLLYKYQAYAGWKHNDTQGEESNISDDFESFSNDRFIVGDEAYVTDEIIRYGETLNSDHIILRMQWPGLGQDDALATIDKMGSIISKAGWGRRSD